MAGLMTVPESQAGASLVLLTVTKSIASSVAPAGSVTRTTSMFLPLSLFAGVPESAPLAVTLNQDGPETFS